MGVYVKGMKMPKDHLACPFRGAITEMCFARKDWCNGFNEDCPLVEVKEPHGRLIDADEILQDKGTRIQVFGGEFAYHETIIQNAPTIIEGENGND